MLFDESNFGPWMHKVDTNWALTSRLLDESNSISMEVLYLNHLNSADLRIRVTDFI